MERRIYKILLSVNLNKEINLVDDLDEIINAAHDFSMKNNYKSLNLCSVEKARLEILTAINSKKKSNNFILSSISGFLRRVCKIYNVDYDSKKNYFTVEEFSTILEEEYINVFRDSALNIGEMIKRNYRIKQMKNSKANDNGLEENNNKTLENTDNSDCDTEKIKKPKRKFPEILTGRSRQGSGFRIEDIEFKTLQDTVRELDSLIGIDEIKEKIKEITSFIIRNNQRCVDLNIDNPGLYYNVAITGNRGTGKNTIAKILYYIYYHLGVIGKGEFIVINSKDVCPGSSLDRYIGSAQSGVIFIDNAQFISTTNRAAPKDNYTTLDEWLSVYKNNFVFIVAGETDGTNEVLKNEKVKKHMNFILNIEDFNENETLKLVKNFALKEKYNIDNSSEEIILKYLNYLKDKKVFENAYTAKRIVEKAIINNGILNNSSCLVNEDFLFEDIKSFESEKIDDIEVDPFEELDGLIGLNEVKEKVKEISAYVSAQLKRKELGLKNESICLHMNYVGNPGTGKTTVARLMGKILKKIGILNTGKFVEASREDLVGKYVGHTALKTAEKIKEADGGILFIDEAYSLASDSSKDYGHEAVSTIVKKMEDLRDNIVIIFAGYPKEMSEFVNMNPGLKDRIQFKLEFVDYKPKELLEIWIKFFKDSQYEIEEDALDEMTKIVDKIYKNRDHNFSNARIMRKCFERIKMAQAVRIMKNNLTESDDIIKINIEDVKKLYDEKDISELQEAVLKRCIGFIQ